MFLLAMKIRHLK